MRAGAWIHAARRVAAAAWTRSTSAAEVERFLVRALRTSTRHIKACKHFASQHLRAQPYGIRSSCAVVCPHTKKNAMAITSSFRYLR
ncbi:hypothetical protein XHC_3608 [Xanthomonas hortorum pv. carotae str. M081]|nr:hypothetical protein XHC_3608 [Xanthomonas hortorum pv. carotae str. M081]